MKNKIILFDGVCNLCNSSVNFVLDHDPEGRFKMASLQSEAARDLGSKHGFDPTELSSIILIDRGEVLKESRAVLRIIKELDTSWRFLTYFGWLPVFITDGIYKWIAANRYRWFGKQSSCRMPEKKYLDRFLSGSAVAQN